MSSTFLRTSFLVAGCAVAAASLAQAPAAPAVQDEVAAGKYLADAAHCAACHTSRADRPFAGNLPMQTKFGTLYTSNITPDPKTGIGSWTEAQFTAALRNGKDDHGEPLYPAMPYVDFTKISDADVHALWVYFRSVAPIVGKPHANQMKFPFNVRPGILAWQAVYFKKGRYVPDPSQSADWNRGAYLVQGLGHCGACHSPKNFAMADKKGHALQGAALDNWFAPDISGGRYSGIADWSVEQIATYLRTGHNEKNVAAVGPMMQTIAQGTQKLTDADRHAIAFYLKNQVSGNDTAPTKQAYDWNDERRAAGRGVYIDHCQSCHGADGKGQAGIAPALAGNTSVTSKGAETVVHSVLQGFAPQGSWGVMPSFNETLDAQEVADVANYVRAAWASNSLASATPSMVNHMRFAGISIAPGVNSALVCPSAAADQLDPSTLREVGVLAQASATNGSGAAQLLRSYQSRHGGTDASAAITTLAGAYCRDVMAQASGSYAEKQQRFVGFMTALSQASVKAR